MDMYSKARFIKTILYKKLLQLEKDKADVYMLEMLYSLILLAATANVAVSQTAMAEFVKRNSTAHLLCNHNVAADRFHRVKWFKSSQGGGTFENRDPALVSWDNASQLITSGKYGIDKSFSLIINNTLIQDEGIYRCYITINVDPHKVIHDVKLMVYDLPWKAPLIQRVNDTFINCSVDRVYPLLYPHVEFKHEEYAVQNEDGTYNTSVSGSIQNISNESKAVSCSYPHFSYSEVSSLIPYPATDVTFGRDDETHPTTPAGLTITTEPPSQGSKNTFLLPAIIFMFIFVAIRAVSFCVILPLYWRKYRKKIFQARTTKSSAPEELNGMLRISDV